MRNVNIMSGIPGSGKTTYIKYMAKENDVIMNRDEYRKDLHKRMGKSVGSNSKIEYQYWINHINSQLRRPNDIWIDQTTIGIGSLKKLLKYISIKDTDRIIVHLIDTPLDVCIERNLKRNDDEAVAVDVLSHMYANHIENAIDEMSVSKLRYPFLIKMIIYKG